MLFDAAGTGDDVATAAVLIDEEIRVDEEVEIDGVRVVAGFTDEVEMGEVGVVAGVWITGVGVEVIVLVGCTAVVEVVRGAVDTVLITATGCDVLVVTMAAA